MQTSEIPLNALNPGRAGALKGGKCRICSLPLKALSSIDEKLRRGDKVAATMRWARKTFKVETAGILDDTYYQHARNHVRMVDRAAKKLSDGQRMQHQKVKLARDVLEDKVDPQAYFGPAALAQDIQKTSERLDAAAEEAYADGEHASLAALSNSLLRAVEIRGKMGGSLHDNPAISLSVTLGELHARLDGILGGDQAQRQHAARNLLGLSSDAPPALGPNLASQADPEPARRRDSATNPQGAPLTIEGDSAHAEPAKPYQEPAGTRG